MIKKTVSCVGVFMAMVCLILVSTLSAAAQDITVSITAVSPALRDLPPDPPSRKHIVFDLELIPRHSGASPLLDEALQKTPGPLVSATNGLNFEGIPINGGEPSDSNGAVGKTQYVEWINSQFEVFDKATGASVSGPLNGNTLFAALGGQCAAFNSGDPIAQYDKLADRWVLTQPVFTAPYYQCIAVSKTSDATGAYNLYAFPLGSTNFPDYPKLAVWPDAYYVTYNLFTSGFAGPQICAFDRAKMLTGAVATAQCFNPSNSSLTFGFPINDGGMLPSDVDGTTPPPAGEPNLIFELDRTSANSNLDLWKFHVDWVTPALTTLTGPTVIPVTPWSYPCGGGGGTCVPQKGTTQTLDTLGDRMMYRLAYRNFPGDHEVILASHTVDSSGITGVRWYEIRDPNGAPTVFQHGTFQPDSTYRWMSSIAMDKNQDIAVGYSLSSNAIFPKIGYTGRLPGDPPGTLETEDVTFSGSGSEVGHSRWGDYSALTVDPVDDCTMWYVNQYVPFTGDFNWHTRINNFKFSACGGATPDFTLAATPASQTVIQGSGTSYTATVAPISGFTGNVSLTVTGLPTGASGVFTPNPIAGGTGSSTLNVTTTTSTPTGTYTLTIKGTSGSLSHMTTVTLVVNGSGTSDFTLTASPGTNFVSRESNLAFYTAKVTPSGGFSGNVIFSVAGIPTGGTASFTPPSVTGSGSSTLKVVAPITTTPGTYTLTITGTSGSLTHSTTVTLVFIQGWFSLAATPSSQTVSAGAGTSYTATVTAAGGFSGVVNFSVTGLPTGATGAFTPPSVTGSGSSTLNVSTAVSTPPGTYVLTIFGRSPGCNKSKTVTLVVGSAADFTLTATPPSQTVAAGSSTSYTATVAPVSGFTGSVNLSVTGLPIGAIGAFTPNPIPGGSGSSTLNVTTGTTTPAGNYTLTITGTSGSLSHTATVTLAVTDFTLTAAPASQTVIQGSGTSYAATVAPLNGFNGNVTLTASGFPTGASGVFTPNPITGGSGSSTLNVSTGTSTPAGTYTLILTGTSGSLSHMTTVTLVVNPASTSDFIITAAPSTYFVSHESNVAFYTAKVTPSGGFTGTVTFSVTGMPTGATVSFTPPSVTTSGSSTLRVASPSATTPGTYTLTITGTSGSLIHSATVTLVFIQGYFTLAASPASQTVTAGSGTSYTATVSGVNSFGGSVDFSVTGLPSGATGMFSPTSVTGSGSSTLSVTTSGATPTGTYTLAVFARSPGCNKSKTVTLVVN